jgi:hypothetical protein
VPLDGEYANVPATFAVAFNCVALSGVPDAMSAGVAHVKGSVAFSTVIVTAGS